MNDQTIPNEPAAAADPIVCLRMPASLLEKVDEARGSATRSVYIREAVEKLTKKRKTP